MQNLLARTFSNKNFLFLGIAYAFLAYAHIPVKIFPHAFDKNAVPQFIVLILVSSIFGIYILRRRNKFHLLGKITLLLWILIIAVLTSAILNIDFVGSLVGETGRFAGVIALFCLILVGLFHSQFNLSQFYKVILVYSVVIFGMAIIGILQKFKLIELPGEASVNGTLGNLDFFGAFLGTSLPFLVFLWLRNSGWRINKLRIYLIVAGVIELISIYFAGPLQAYVDIAIVIIAGGVYFLRKYIPHYDYSLNVRTIVGTFFILIWIEFIFLMPFLGYFIPVLGNDEQVKIRGDFWLAAARQFFSSPIFGIGPDQYGNYYEKYRTFNSLEKYSNLLSNDAHSAPLQTLATLGILGVLAFILLLALVIRAFLIIISRDKDNKKFYYALALYVFVFISNAAVSPITNPHKYLVWAVCGFFIGMAYRGEGSQFNYKMIPVLVSSLVIPSLVVLANFIPAQLAYLSANETYAKNKNAEIDIKQSNFLPCTIYYNNVAIILSNKKDNQLLKYTQSQLKSNPRCVDAWIVLSKIRFNQNEIALMKEPIYKLIEIAPTRMEVVTLASLYANKAKDSQLNELVDKQLQILNPGIRIIK